MSESKYTTIQVKREVKDVLKLAVDRLNATSSNSGKVTVAGLVNRLAEAYSLGMDEDTIKGNRESWVLDGIPVILTSDGSKHFRELKEYEPDNCAVIVSEFIRSEAMARRHERVGLTNGIK